MVDPSSGIHEETAQKSKKCQNQNSQEHVKSHLLSPPRQGSDSKDLRNLNNIHNDWITTTNVHRPPRVQAPKSKGALGTLPCPREDSYWLGLYPLAVLFLLIRWLERGCTTSPTHRRSPQIHMAAPSLPQGQEGAKARTSGHPWTHTARRRYHTSHVSSFPISSSHIWKRNRW